ncbi:MAG: hypothetical protein P8X70_00010 [Nanoarchaeota archaeon]
MISINPPDKVATYKEKTEALIDYYNEKGLLDEISVEGDLSRNVKDTLEVLDSN